MKYPPGGFQRDRYAEHALRVLLLFYPSKGCEKEMKRIAKEVLALVEESIDLSGAEVVGSKVDEKGFLFLIRYPPKLAISMLVNNAKARSSRLLRREHGHALENCEKGKGLWQRRYMALTLDGLGLYDDIDERMKEA